MTICGHCKARPSLESFKTCKRCRRQSHKLRIKFCDICQTILGKKQQMYCYHCTNLITYERIKNYGKNRTNNPQKRLYKNQACKIIYDRTKESKDDPNSLFKDPNYVESFVGTTCPRTKNEAELNVIHKLEQINQENEIQQSLKDKQYTTYFKLKKEYELI